MHTVNAWWGLDIDTCPCVDVPLASYMYHTSDLSFNWALYSMCMCRDFSDNQIATLPDGVFDSLTGLFNLWVLVVTLLKNYAFQCQGVNNAFTLLVAERKHKTCWSQDELRQQVPQIQLFSSHIAPVQGHVLKPDLSSAWWRVWQPHSPYRPVSVKFALYCHAISICCDLAMQAWIY